MQVDLRAINSYSVVHCSGVEMPRPHEGAQAKEVLRMIDDFRLNHDTFFSKGYLNSDGKRALMRLMRAGLQIAYGLKGFTLKRFKNGSDTDIEEILIEIESRLKSDTSKRSR